MHHEKIASTFLKKCGEDKKWKDKKSILIINGKLHRHFLKMREDKKQKDKKIQLDYQGKIAPTFLKKGGEDKKWKDKKSILIIKGKHRRFLKMRE